MSDTDLDQSTAQIKHWRSIVTLLVFVITNVAVLFPSHLPIPCPLGVYHVLWDCFSSLRIISRRPKRVPDPLPIHHGDPSARPRRWLVFRFSVNFITAPLIADLFLLAILAIGREEVFAGTVGEDNIHPLDIMAFFITLAYIAISIDASGLIRWLAFKVLQKGGDNGHALFCYLYAFFFALATFAGNDPIVLSGTAFLAYMTRVSSNIKHPRAWIHMQFSIANIGSAILVSSNPTNLVLAGAFNIQFLHYTANIVVPVVCTALVGFPFLLFVVFDDDGLIPKHITLHQLPDHLKQLPPVNPNIKSSKTAGEEESDADQEQQKLAMLNEIMNPFLDKWGAMFGGVIMTVTLALILAVNASGQKSGQDRPVFWVTLPAAFVMLCRDLVSGWRHRRETRDFARSGGAAALEMTGSASAMGHVTQDFRGREKPVAPMTPSSSPGDQSAESHDVGPRKVWGESGQVPLPSGAVTSCTSDHRALPPHEQQPSPALGEKPEPSSERGPTTLISLAAEAWRWARETFPTVTTVVEHLPFALVPFALSMFVLVQALVSQGWVPVFAHGWDHWVNKTGTVGAIGGMAFLAVVLCNFAGTNIGTTILLCRIVQSWVQIHQNNGIPITERNFWATVYSMALGVNYGAFSTAFSASLAGLLWRDILRRKHIIVRELDFARVNLPIITIAMVIGCVVLVGEMYIFRSTAPYISSS